MSRFEVRLTYNTLFCSVLFLLGFPAFCRVHCWKEQKGRQHRAGPLRPVSPLRSTPIPRSRCRTGTALSHTLFFGAIIFTLPTGCSGGGFPKNRKRGHTGLLLRPPIKRRCRSSRRPYNLFDFLALSELGFLLEM